MIPLELLALGHVEVLDVAAIGQDARVSAGRQGERGRTRGRFPTSCSTTPAQEWKRPPREWVEAKTQFAIVFGERFAF